MNDYPETIPCPPCRGDCQQGRVCPAEIADDLEAARGIVWCFLGCLAVWAGVIAWAVW
jgi:hypothetical protein